MKGRIKDANSSDVHTIYAFAHCEAWLEDYAKTIHRSSDELIDGVASLLSAQVGKTSVVPMREMRVQTAKVGKAVESVARHGSSLRGTQKRKRIMSAAARKRIGDAQRARWAKWKKAA